MSPLNPGTSGAAMRVFRDRPRLTATQVSAPHYDNPQRRNEQPVSDPPVGVARGGETRDLKLGYVRIQVLTNAGALDRGKQLAVVERLTAIAADAAGDPALAGRTWVLLTEAPDGGWGLAGHANTNEELVAAARAQIASRAASEKTSG